MRLEDFRRNYNSKVKKKFTYAHTHNIVHNCRGGF